MRNGEKRKTFNINGQNLINIQKHIENIRNKGKKKISPIWIKYEKRIIHGLYRCGNKNKRKKTNKSRIFWKVECYKLNLKK